VTEEHGWPTFIVIGGTRCGTTSLHSYLDQHPEVLMSRIKEPNFFIPEGAARNFGGPGADMILRQSVFDESAYRSLFPRTDGVSACGESSPRYLSTPGTAARIRSRLPEVRLIAILRNPVDRALSDFSLRTRDGWEPCRSVEQAVADEERRLAENWATGLYRYRGYYGRQLHEYFQVFARRQILVVLYEDLVTRPDWLYQLLFSFIGVDSSFRPRMDKSLNVSGVISNPVLRLLWTRSNRIKDFARPFLPLGARRSISEFFISREKQKLTFSPAVRERLLADYREDILLLQSLIDRDLSQWLSIEGE
jgi:hypothetical protein